MSDVMLLGVLRMPIPDKPDFITLLQFVARAREAADRIESDAKEIKRLKSEVSRLEREEEGAKEAFGVIIQEKRDLENRCDCLQKSLDEAHDQIRRMGARCA